MEYIYTVMLLNKAGKEINEENMTAVLKSAGVEVDAAKIKSLIAALEGVDIEEVIANSSSVAVASPIVSASPPTQSSNDTPAAKEEKKEEIPDAAAAAGLGSLF